MIAPRSLEYGENRDNVLRFVYELRRQAFITRRLRPPRRKRDRVFYVDLDQLEKVDLEGALILAAELDRIRHVYSFRPVLIDRNWRPFVKAILHALGLYDMIDAYRGSGEPPEDIRELLHSEGLAIVPFLSGTEVEGSKALELANSLHRACDPLGAAPPSVYTSLVEAMANAVNHAYDIALPGDGLPRVKRWWAGALVDRTEGKFNLVVYDQGVGIPATLPRRSWWSVVRGRLPESSDDALIVGALEYGRSGTGEAGRGNGLWSMCQLTDAFEAADVEFTSGKGRVSYAKGGEVTQAELPHRFCGTMVRWSAKVAGLEHAL